MIRVLICWEDEYCDKLDVCLRRARHALAGPEDAAPLLMKVSAKGHGGFLPYIRKGWPIARHKGIPKSGGPIDYLVCIADADRAPDCCGVGAPPERPADTSAWVREANQRWTAQLQKEAQDQEGRVIGRFLRWNKESLLIAGHDVPAALDRLGCRDGGGVRSFLQGCKPDPRGLQDHLFVDHYRQPGSCLQELLKAGNGPRLGKGDRRMDDALGEIADHALPNLLSRIRDLAELAELLRRLR
jgi:hypothetical protein